MGAMKAREKEEERARERENLAAQTKSAAHRSGNNPHALTRTPEPPRRLHSTSRLSHYTWRRRRSPRHACSRAERGFNGRPSPRPAAASTPSAPVDPRRRLTACAFPLQHSRASRIAPPRAEAAAAGLRIPHRPPTTTLRATCQGPTWSRTRRNPSPRSEGPRYGRPSARDPTDPVRSPSLRVADLAWCWVSAASPENPQSPHTNTLPPAVL